MNRPKDSNGKKKDYELIIGGCDVQAQHYEKVLEGSNNWKINISSIEMGGDEICKNGCDAIISSLSLGINVPRAELTKINERLGAVPHISGAYWDYVIPNNAEINLPDVVFNFGTYNVTLKPDDYIIKIGRVSNHLL